MTGDETAYLYTTDLGQGENHTAYVGIVYSTGDRHDGYYGSTEWSGPGRDLRPYWWWCCLCNVDGSLHETEEAAEREARGHTPNVTRGPLPMLLPSRKTEPG